MGKSGTVIRMAQSLMYQARKSEVDLSGLTIDNFNTYLDDAFMDGGEVRCVKFGDLAMPYANTRGSFESDAWMSAQWECIEAAIDRIHALSRMENE